jgi:AraC-like DNA-binding protein
MNDVFHTIYLLAALQGLLLSAFLFTKKQNHAANLVLAAAMLALSIELATVVYYTKGWYKQFPHAMGFSYPFPFLYGPLFFLYAKLVSKKQERLCAIQLLHFTPVFATYCITAPIFLSSGEEKIAFLNNMLLNIHPPFYTIAECIIPVQGITYTILTIKLVAGYNRNIKDTYSNTELINLNWLKYLTLGMVVIWSIVALVTFVRVALPPVSRIDALLNVALAVLIYSIGYMGLKQPEIFLNPSTLAPETPQPEKYKRSGLSDDIAEGIKQKLTTVMANDKLYLDNELTLQKLADRMNVSSHNLSEVINSRLHLSYFDFINGFRVEEFKSRIGDPANEHYNILSIAFDSGFKSKGTFNSIFKKSAGMTPSEYKARIRSTARKAPYT